MRYTIICAVNKGDVLNDNLLSSRVHIEEHQIIFKTGYTNICKAYNDALKQAVEDIVIFVHQDVVLGDHFFHDLDTALEKLEDKNWGVLGVAGKISATEKAGHITDRGKEWGTAEGLPCEVMTLDELLLVTRKNDFVFDEGLTSQHFFGTDICLQSIERGMKNYAIDAFCHHNCWSLERLPADELPESFQIAKEYIKNKWNKYLPIHTTCVTIK